MQEVFRIIHGDTVISVNRESARRIMDQIQNQMVEYQRIDDASAEFIGGTMLIYEAEGIVAAIRHIQGAKGVSLPIAKAALEHWRKA